MNKGFKFVFAIVVIMGAAIINNQFFQTKTDLQLKYECSQMIDSEKTRFTDDRDQDWDTPSNFLWGVYYSKSLNSCVSKWYLWAGDIGSTKLGYFDLKQNKILKEVIEFSSSGDAQYNDPNATEEKGREYESTIGLQVDTSFGTPLSSEENLGKSICRFDIDQATKNRIDKLETISYYDTFEAVYYSRWLNTCISKWKRYWENDQSLQILYYDALSGQLLNDPNLPHTIEEYKILSPEKLEERLQLEKV